MSEISVVKCLSLTQPWATLVAIGAKRYETRSWRTDYAGWLAIHASKGFPRDCQRLCYLQPFAACLAGAGFNKPDDLPRGQVLAIVRLANCQSTNHWRPSSSVEFDFGDYSANRFAWKLDDVHPVRPFDAKGALGIWTLPRPITAEDLA